ncbi:putative intracellular phospholipase B that catalyzes the double deacylation of phosphatidylcholine (PC) to glycerophosphocholine (GroPCho) [Lyophyllum shimeji]|uniref:Lysophospholipase NTE1 n=1 Tax=Lyophyllum shimeji TaxID=47721 RepID=A0A9P3PGN7_LYOSH|nr:putative intracellular phospholipase B that catalyzes the double deacylation of phosphatidylcholine (PC) to glycerophosphocholine (GroPCho) [Lyophyllum shimeji]
MDHEVLESVNRHPLVSLVSACFWVILWVLSCTRALVAFVTITIPRYIYAILSYSMTLTLNFWNFAVLFALSAIALNYWIRLRYLNDYAQLKEPPLIKPDVNELHPDVNTDPPPTFHNYLDDFLQAVRVFGFLEKPVFHELARHLQTRRLIAGDSMSLDQDKSFYCVVDGMVQVFAQTGPKAESGQSLWDHEDMNGYQLLNEVGSGGTLSSLFTILSLFTEDVKMSWQDDLPDVADEFTEIDTDTPAPTSRQRTNSDVSQLDLETKPGSQLRRSSVSSTASTVHPSEAFSPTRGGSLSPNSHDGSQNRRMSSFSRSDIRPSTVSRGGVVARATEDTTLAVIPAEAFRRLTKKYPKATGHIVQVILTRFSRVTFNAAHKYLGLTSEVLRTEKAINDIACHPLPASFYESGGVQHLRQRFDGRSSDTDDYFSFTSSPLTTSPQTRPRDSIDDSSKASGSSSRSSSKVDLSKAPLPSFKRQRSSPFSRGSRDTVQAGDLFVPSNATSEVHRSLNRSYSILNTPRVSRKLEPDQRDGRSDTSSIEDFDLREEVMSCIAKSIGLLQPPLSGSDSVEASPRLPPTDSRHSSGMFNSPFGSLSLLDINDDSSSLTASSVASSGDYMSGLDNEVEILFFAAGSTLAKAGELNAGLFYVIEGFLDILLPSETQSSREPSKPMSSQAGQGAKSKSAPQKLLFTVKPGGIAGYLSSLCNTASYVDITAKTDTYVGFLSAHALERLLEKRPIVLLTLAKRLISMLSPLVLHIDASLDWVQVNAGQVLWRPNDASDSFYIVINGRLRAITETEAGAVTIVGEYGQGDTVGELDVITSSPRRNTVHAIRDTELIRMPQTLFNAISARNPQTTAQLLRNIASRVRDEVDSSSNAQARNLGPDLGHNNTNLKTVAILPVSRNVPIDAFARKLQAALEGIGASTSFLNQASVSSHLGRHAFTRMGKLKSAGWLADQEQKYRTVLYVADSPVNSSWTQTCIRQADCVMIVGMGDDPSIGEYERLLLSMKTTARKELILLHPDRSVAPGSTREWLKNRPWVHRHVHVELPGLILPIPKAPTHLKDPDAVTALKNLKDKVQSGIQKYRGAAADLRPQRSPHVNDFARLARRICGKSIGLVLGGGGARGIAHLGLLRALEEYEIPIDHIAGTSIGAFIGGLYAREGDIISTAGRAKQFCGRMGNIWRILSDVTYPIVAYTTGHEFNRSIFKAFYDLHIEDMWLPYFCNTTNIITSRMEIHETGYAWRFIRASMSLVGLLPPLCDNGNLLVDGGYIDNLPVSAMFSMGASEVFACDVGSLDDNSPRNFGDSVSGWWLLINRWNPFSNAKHVPAITEIQSRLAYVSSVKTLEDAKVAKGCFYIQMPVHEYGTLQWSKFEEIHEKGYLAAMEILKKLDEEDRLPFSAVDGKEVTGNRKKGRSARRNSV